MSNAAQTKDSANDRAPERTYFERQRQALVHEVAFNLENVLQNINKLNRSLEGIIAVGNEFSQVEALWSQFENVMAKNEDASKDEVPPADAKSSQDV